MQTGILLRNFNDSKREINIFDIIKWKMLKERYIYLKYEILLVKYIAAYNT